jgi:hypothetical protein
MKAYRLSGMRPNRSIGDKTIPATPTGHHTKSMQGYATQQAKDPVGYAATLPDAIQRAMTPWVMREGPIKLACLVEHWSWLQRPIINPRNWKQLPKISGRENLISINQLRIAKGGFNYLDAFGAQ